MVGWFQGSVSPLWWGSWYWVVALVVEWGFVQGSRLMVPPNMVVTVCIMSGGVHQCFVVVMGCLPAVMVWWFVVFVGLRIG